MADQPKCELCGEPMPEGEEMFKFHGYSGNCPMPPLKKAESVEAMVEYVHRTAVDGSFWLDFRVNRQPYAQVGPFATQAERQRVHDDMLNMMRSFGAKDMPNATQ